MTRRLVDAERDVKLSIVETFQDLWDGGPEAIAAHKCDPGLVKMIGNNPLFRGSDGTRCNIARAPLDPNALLFLCEVTRETTSMYYPSVKRHLESGRINRYSTKSEIKRIIGFVSDRKIIRLKKV